LKKLDSLDVVLVASVHNEFRDPSIKGSVDGLFTRWADPNAAPGDRIDNLIVVGAIDMNSVISPDNPYRPWMAMAPGIDITIPLEATTDDYVQDDGASFGKCLLLVHLTFSTANRWPWPRWRQPPPWLPVQLRTGGVSSQMAIPGEIS
jgi:hypothetical protein